MTVLVPVKSGEAFPEVSIEQVSDCVWKVTIETGDQSISLEADLAAEEPAIGLLG